MKDFIYIDEKTVELAGVAASAAGGCRPCLDYHFRKALEVGCTKEQLGEVIELGKMIKERPVKDIYEQAEKLIKMK
ncbi:MAG: carboxymuconolactone decarboxylase family protein [Marinilabiliales bacterium]|nr:carboxymuconolactone decarboxylase family protein [Marinilabiliales bacterium]